MWDVTDTEEAEEWYLNKMPEYSAMLTECSISAHEMIAELHKMKANCSDNIFHPCLAEGRRLWNSATGQTNIK